MVTNDEGRAAREAKLEYLHDTLATMKRPGSDGDSRYLNPTSSSWSAWTAENAFSNARGGTSPR